MEMCRKRSAEVAAVGYSTGEDVTRQLYFSTKVYLASDLCFVSYEDRLYETQILSAASDLFDIKLHTWTHKHE